MKPALSAEEWGMGEGAKASAGAYVNALSPELRHAKAARCLYGQPFGFTQEHIRAIRSAAETLDAEWGFQYRPKKHPQSVLAWEAADLIEALLPPEEP